MGSTSSVSEPNRGELVRAILAGVLGRAPGEAEIAAHLATLPPDATTLGSIQILMSNLTPMRAPRFVPPGHHYSPITPTHEVEQHLHALAAHPVDAPLPGITTNRAAMLALWHTLLPYLAQIPFGAEERSALRYRFENGAYSWGDGSILHAMILHARPQRIVEIGSGWSTVCTLDTIERRLGAPCEVTVIEPFPDLMHDLVGEGYGPTHVIAQPVQRVPLEVFDALEANDILFIDSTHVVRTGSDVCHEVFEILPRLRPGVLVHFHDVFWPFEYPWPWVVDENRSWSELYLLRALLSDNPRWEIVMFNDYLAKVAQPEIAATYPDFLRNPGGALWLRKL